MGLTWLRKSVKAPKNIRASMILAKKFFFSDLQSFKSVTKKKELLLYIFNFDEKVSILNDFFNSGWTYRFPRSLIGVALCAHVAYLSSVSHNGVKSYLE